MGKTAEEIQRELEEAKKQAGIDANRRKLMYAEGELAIVRREKELEAIKIFIGLVQKYNISNEDVILLIENVPFV